MDEFWKLSGRNEKEKWDVDVKNEKEKVPLFMIILCEPGMV